MRRKSLLFFVMPQRTFNPSAVHLLPACRHPNENESNSFQCSWLESHLKNAQWKPWTKPRAMGQLNQFNDSLIELFVFALHISIVSSKGMKLRPPPWLAGLVASGLEPIGSSVEAQLACGCLFIDLGGSVTSASTYLHHPPLSSLPHSLTLLPDITVLALIPPKWLRFLSHFLDLIAKKKKRQTLHSHIVYLIIWFVLLVPLGARLLLDASPALFLLRWEIIRSCSLLTELMRSSKNAGRTRKHQHFTDVPSSVPSRASPHSG